MERKTMMTCDNNKLYISTLLLILQIRYAFRMTGLFTIKQCKRIFWWVTKVKDRKNANKFILYPWIVKMSEP